MSKRSASGAIMIGSVILGTLQSLSSTPGWREEYYSEKLREANKIGNQLNAKKEALMQSFERAYTELSNKHNLQKLNFNNESSTAMTKALNAFSTYGETELINKYEALNKEMNNYLNKYQTDVDKTVAKMTNGKVYSLSSLAKQHNDKVDDVIAEIQNKAIKHSSDVKDKLSSAKDKDTVKLEAAKDKFKTDATDKIQEAESKLVEKQGNESNKLQQQKYDKYNTLAAATEAANDWISRIEEGSIKNQTKWHDHLTDFTDKVFGTSDLKWFKENVVKQYGESTVNERDKIQAGQELDVEFKI